MSSIYDNLNPAQQEAVRHTEGPLLILAGAGSGKTRVITHRIAYLIEECGVKPWHIFAITFTNKAAREMRERVDALLHYGAEDVWVSTFHSACVRILRRYIDRIGYDRSFSIYDTDDSRVVVKEAVKKLGLDPKVFRERAVLSAISSAKNRMMDAGQMAEKARFEHDPYLQKIALIFKEYQDRMKSNNALDFDDLLLKTVELFRQDEDALRYYQERFRYIMVDEYQDTNQVQFILVSLLAARYRNLCVVGDDDQSIYKFRGADIRNILDFEKVFPDAWVVRLEENYRSTKVILDAANGVIHHNQGRKDKTLWTQKGEGALISLRIFQNDTEEAGGVVRDIAVKKKPGTRYSDFAVLYRTNAQSRALEERFVMTGMPYRVYGGINFYQRKEIKDILAYLKTVDNGQDDVAVSRIINVPKRGIGSTSLGKVQFYADERQISLYDALTRAASIPGVGRSAGKMKAFTDMIEVYRLRQADLSLKDLYDEILETSGYLDSLKEEDSDEAQARIENLDELRNKIAEYEDSAAQPSLSELLEQIALVADIDNLSEDDDRVVLMTLHSAKGLEFPHVYMVGMEEGLFPSYMSLNSDNYEEEIEEERRLCYVGITRAMETLMMTCARERRIHGNYQHNEMSRFLKEIPSQLLDRQLPAGRRTSYAWEEKEDLPFGGGGFTDSRNSSTGSYGKRAKSIPVIQKYSDMQKVRPSYGPGDRVRHVRFGAGTVKEVLEKDKDYQVTVDFDRIGIKKMMAGFAKLQKI